MENPILSVIIPMYNCGAIITRCLDSIDYSNSEIIVVDDGSKDNGAEIVTQYAENHPNVRLIHKENGGVSSARNVGLDNANGQYIMFVDADDYVAKDGIKRMVDLAIAENVDVLKYGNICLSDNDPEDHSSLKDIPFITRSYLGRAEALRHYDLSDYVIWDALFNRSLIEKYHIRFDEDLHLREDDVFMGKIYSVSSKVICCDLPLYRYIQCSQYSSTHRQSKERNRILIESGYWAIQHRSEFIKKQLPDAQFPLERYKYMRWVCSPRQAVEAGYTFREYKQILKQFAELGVWPLSYKWIKIGGWDYSWQAYLKKVIITILQNCPSLGYVVAKIRYK